MIDAIYVNADTGVNFGLAYTPSLPRRGESVDLGDVRWRVKDVVHAPQFPIHKGDLVVGHTPHVYLVFERHLHAQ